MGAFLVWLASGLAAGTLTTVAAAGGGVALVVGFSLAMGPHAALAITAPALLIGNLHRSWMYRDAIDRRVAAMFLLGAFPGALVGSLLSASLPELVLDWVLLGVTAFALARSAGLASWKPAPRAFIPFAFGAGTVAASSGAGILVSPLLVAGGLSGPGLVATGALIAAAMHMARVAGYGVSGLFGGVDLITSLLLGAGILGGNLLGAHLRDRLGEARCTRITQLVLALSTLTALTAIVRAA